MGGEEGGEGNTPPRRGGYDRGERGENGNWPPRRGGRGGGGRGGGGRPDREFNLDNEAFPTLG